MKNNGIRGAYEMPKAKEDERKLSDSTLRENIQDSQLAGLLSPSRQELVFKKPELLPPGLRLRRERYLKNMTLEQMSSFLDISTSYLGAVERGSRPISKHLAEVIHRQLGISYDYIREGYTVTGTMVAQFVREPEGYGMPFRRKLDILLNTCNPDEEEQCYHMIHTFLSSSRNAKPDFPDSKNQKTE